MKHYMSYEDRMERMAEYGEPESAADRRWMHRTAISGMPRDSRPFMKHVQEVREERAAKAFEAGRAII